MRCEQSPSQRNRSFETFSAKIRAWHRICSFRLFSCEKTAFFCQKHTTPTNQQGNLLLQDIYATKIWPQMWICQAFLRRAQALGDLELLLLFACWNPQGVWQGTFFFNTSNFKPFFWDSLFAVYCGCLMVDQCKPAIKTAIEWGDVWVFESSSCLL